MELEHYLEKVKGSPRMASTDYLELMHIALETGDKIWFQELAKEKDRLALLEEEARQELGWLGN